MSDHSFISCPACGATVSSDAYSCPQCGKLLRMRPSDAWANLQLAIQSIVGVVVLILVVIAIAGALWQWWRPT